MVDTYIVSKDTTMDQGVDEDESEDEERETQVAYREHVFKFDAFEKVNSSLYIHQCTHSVTHFIEISAL